MLIYHCNFGWPLADEGALILYRDQKESRENIENKAEPVSADHFKKCPAPLEAHNGNGEAVDFIDIAANKEGNCFCGIQNKKLGIAVTLQFPKKQLPWLTSWQHFSKGEYITGIEPGTHPPIGQARARKEGSLVLLEPGESKRYNLELNVLTEENSIQSFINNL
jgi:hypothetical protein